MLIIRVFSIKIWDAQLFADHLAVYERENGLPKITVYHLPAVDEPLTSLKGGRVVDFIDPVYCVIPINNIGKISSSSCSHS